MSKHARPTPKHRGASKHAHLAERPKTLARNAVIVSSVAVAVTGVAIGSTVAGEGAAAAPAAADIDALTVGSISAADIEAATERDAVISRGNERSADTGDGAGARATATTKAAAFIDAPAAITGERKLSDSDPRDIARALLGEFGFSSSQFGCLDSLWTRESNWRWNADNPSSSAYGIPQALPGSKMSSAGGDWATNPATQIRWGLGYIQDRYGSPCGAWGHSESHGWY